MNNFEKPGHTITLTAPAGGVVSGNVYKIGQLVVVAAISAGAGEAFEGTRSGVFSDLPKDDSSAWSEGDPLFWDDANGVFTPASASGLVLCGTAVSDTPLADSAGKVLLGVTTNADVA